MIQLNLNEAYEVIKPVFLFMLGMAIYSIFIFKFYRFIARKDVFKLNLEQYNTTSLAFLKKLISIIFYIIEYILLFPFFAFFWFGILTILLTFLGRDQTIQSILFVSIAIVATIRVTAYYKEDLSRDLAKMLPFALLAVFLVDMTYFSFNESIELLKQIPSLWEILLYYLLFVILLEFILRISNSISKIFIRKDQ